ncbi:hypothetical protein UA32_11850 [Photobacterium angustum]|uniref:PRTRC system protein E n=1 Tax=Photobacterium angustum TaxID=661 RepID=A0ABX5H244_PHOAN|nr:hypothetical protein [Photobacterium angustum]KJG37653.1 hypothetical protein UA32_11850 [Photobacterium angustum]PSX07110.1 hypothetical protein C0W27_16195 [Photobacterium angustum]
MLLQAVINTLQTSEISDCNLKISLLNGKPTIALVFDKNGASPSDSKKIQQLRECFTYPLIAQAEDCDSLEQSVSNDLAHFIEELSLTAKAIEESAVPTKVAEKRVAASNTDKKGKSPAKSKTPKSEVAPKPDIPQENTKTTVVTNDSESDQKPIEGNQDLSDLFNLSQFSV